MVISAKGSQPRFIMGVRVRNWQHDGVFGYDLPTIMTITATTTRTTTTTTTIKLTITATTVLCSLDRETI